MKKLIKGFTLIELIIVMAILAILMSALMNFYKPVRQTFVDSTMIEDMRTTQNGILSYLTESVRYAENLTIYDQGAKIHVDDGSPGGKNFTVNNPKDAYEAFITENSITQDSDKKRVQIIVINRSDGYTSTGTYVPGGTRGATATLSGGKQETVVGGRLITNILKTGATDTPTAAAFTDAAGTRTKGSTGDTYMVLGGAYYGNSDYAIFIDKAKTWPNNKYNGKEGGITFAVQTAMTDETGIVQDGANYGSTTVTKSVDKGGLVYITSTQAANTMNCEKPKYYVKSTTGQNNANLGDPDICKTAANTTAGSLSPTGTGVTKPTDNTYIVVLEPDEKR